MKSGVLFGVGVTPDFSDDSTTYQANACALVAGVQTAGRSNDTQEKMISFDDACKLAEASRVACDRGQSARVREYEARMAALGKRIGTWVLTAIPKACNAPGSCVCLDGTGDVAVRFVTKKAGGGSVPYVCLEIDGDRKGDGAKAVKAFLEKTAGFPGSAFTLTRSSFKVIGKHDCPVSTLSICLSTTKPAGVGPGPGPEPEPEPRGPSNAK